MKLRSGKTYSSVIPSLSKKNPTISVVAKKLPENLSNEKCYCSVYNNSVSVKSIVIQKITKLLEKCAMTQGKFNKMLISIETYDYMIENFKVISDPNFSVNYKFIKTVYNKGKELLKEIDEYLLVDAKFQADGEESAKKAIEAIKKIQELCEPYKEKWE